MTTTLVALAIGMASQFVVPVPGLPGARGDVEEDLELAKKLQQLLQDRRQLNANVDRIHEQFRKAAEQLDSTIAVLNKKVAQLRAAGVSEDDQKIAGWNKLIAQLTQQRNMFKTLKLKKFGK